MCRVRLRVWCPGSGDVLLTQSHRIVPHTPLQKFARMLAHEERGLPNSLHQVLVEENLVRLAGGFALASSAAPDVGNGLRRLLQKPRALRAYSFRILVPIRIHYPASGTPQGLTGKLTGCAQGAGTRVGACTVDRFFTRA